MSYLPFTDMGKVCEEQKPATPLDLIKVKDIFDRLRLSEFQTSSKEVALQCIKILGRDYCLIDMGKSYCIKLSLSTQGRNLIKDIEDLILNPSKDKYYNVYSLIENLRIELYDTCKLVEKLIKNQEEEFLEKEKEKIEREEEIRARVRYNWR